jgi:hypothetical protein
LDLPANPLTSSPISSLPILGPIHSPLGGRGGGARGNESLLGGQHVRCFGVMEVRSFGGSEV